MQCPLGLTLVFSSGPVVFGTCTPNALCGKAAVQPQKSQLDNMEVFVLKLWNTTINR